MGWLWGTGNDGGKGSTKSDPLKDLDPSLREFLEKESPVKYKTAQAPPTSASPTLPAQYSDSSTQTLSSAGESAASVAPPQSLFPDGRYAHLWSTYKPLSDIEDATKSDQEKLLDVLNGFNERKAQIGRAAVENCSEEQWAVSDCFRSGGWKARMTMCRAENRQFERCYNMQSRFLKALGYLSNYDRPPEVDEQIQMHADTLYHRMLERERAVEEAKTAGLPIPTFTDIMSSSAPSASAQPQSTPGVASSEDQPLPAEFEGLKPKVKAQVRDRLKNLTPEEREVEEKALAMELAAGETIGKQINQIFEDQGKAKRLRKEQGRETVADKIGTIFGW